MKEHSVLVHPSRERFGAAVGEPARTIVHATAHATIVAWRLDPGQAIRAHIHPHGQDTWTILAGSGRYLTDRQGGSLSITVGDVVIAEKGQVHGVVNEGSEPLLFISVVSPGEAGYELVG